VLLVEGPTLPADSAASALAPYFDVVRVSSADALDQLDPASFQAVFSPAAGPRGVLDEISRVQADQLLDALGEGVFICNAAGGLTWANRRFDLFDAEMKERLLAVASEAARVLQDRAQRAERVDAIGSRKVTVGSPDGHSFYELVVSPIAPPGQAGTSGDGEPAPIEQVAAVVWDITATRRIEQKIDAIDRAGDELVRLEADLVRDRNAAERLKVLEERIVHYARELLRFDHFTIHLLERDTGRLELVMQQGLPPEIQDIDLYASRDGNGITGYVAATGRSYICHDTSRDERYITGLETAGSSLTVPLFMHDEVIGVFNVESEQIGAFSEDDRQFAEIFARYVALAFHILDLLVVERSTTSQTVSGVVEGEIEQPLEDLVEEAEWLRSQAEDNPEAAKHAERILGDIDSIRRGMSDVKRGPRTILGVEQAQRETRVEPLLQDKIVLVVDDEAVIRDTIADVLRRRGCEVVVCEDGGEAVRHLEQASEDPEQRFDLVVSDIKLANRTGYEVFSAARKLGSDVGVLLMTGFGYDPHHSIVRASQEGLQCVLFKPFRVQRLLDEVRKALTKEDEADEPRPDAGDSGQSPGD